MQETLTADLPSLRFEPRIYGVGAWTDHLYFAYDLVALLRPATMVELGTDQGESYFAFCQSALENKTGSRCFAIDTWRGDEQAGQYDETTFRQVDAHNRAHYAELSTLMRCTFDDALRNFHNASIDLFHLDGLHSETAVRHDLENWLPKLRPGGVLLLHDVLVRNRDFGVWKVWKELSERGRCWTFAEGPGLGLWQARPNESLPTLLETLLSGDDTSRSELVEYYRERTAQLRARIAREWRDGTVRRLPFLQQTVIQVFYSYDGIHREENSINARVGHDGWKEISIALPPAAQARPLRIDFVSPLTILEIAWLRLRRGKEICFQAESAAQFDEIALAGEVARLPNATHLRLQVTGMDPQLILPPIAGGNFLLQMRMRVEPADSIANNSPK
jgi:Methyltransferase domain